MYCAAAGDEVSVGSGVVHAVNKICAVGTVLSVSALNDDVGKRQLFAGGTVCMRDAVFVAVVKPLTSGDGDADAL